MRKMLLTAALCAGIALPMLKAETLFTETLAEPARWRSNDSGALSVAVEPGADGKILKMHCKIDNPATGNAWPQVIRWIPAIKVDGNDCYLEFEGMSQIAKGKFALRILPKPQSDVKEAAVPLKSGEWTTFRIPLIAKKADAKLDGFGFVIARRSQKAGDDGVFMIRNMRIVRGEKVAVSASKIRPGVLSCTVRPATARALDTRLEIEINNLLINGYFREGGAKLPPVGWFAYGGESYGESRHDGRSIRLPGIAGQSTVALRQNGIVMVPGEKYRLSGYIRGGDFTGAMSGHIGIACDNWSKIRAYNFTNADIKPDWQYFDLVFTPDVSKAKEYETVVYRSGAGGGWIEVDRLILEPLSEKAIKNSRNKYAADKFDAAYTAAAQNGKFRTGPPSPDYELVWSDEFDGPKVDESKWKVYTMDFNGKRPYVLTPESISFDGRGCILFTTRLGKNGIVEQPRISSTTKKTFAYGYIECRFELHDSDLANASFWMLPEGHMDPYDPVNKGMEIDIMECITPSRDALSHTTHWYNNDPKTGKRISFSGGTRPRTAPGLNKGFHTVALEWTPTELIFSIDGVESWRLNAKDHPIPVNAHNIIFSFGGRHKDILKRPGFATTFKADYVRVYQKKQPAAGK